MRLESSGQTRPTSPVAVATELAAAMLVHFSFWLLVLSMLAIHPAPPVMVALALLPVPLYFVSRLHSIGNLTPVYVIFLPLLVGLVGARFFGTGFRELFNFLARAINAVHELALFPTVSGYPATDVPGAAGEAAILLLAIVMAGLLAHAICRKIRGLAVGTVFLPALLCFVIGLKPSMFAFIFYAVAATFYLILLETRSKGTARRLTWLNGEVSVALLVFLMLLALSLSGFERSEHVEELQERIATRITAFRYAPDEAADGMPEGDLNQAGPLHYDEAPALTVETPNAFSMYLRGYSGDVLKDGKWEPLDGDAYFKNYDLTGPWVRSKSFSPAISLGQLLDLKWQVQTAQYKAGERDAMALPRYPMTIRNERAYSDRMFAPYEVSAESKGFRHAELSQEGLRAKGVKGRRSYQLIVYQPLTKDYGNVTSKALIGEDAPYNSLYEDAFVPVEQVYRKFARENERDIPGKYRAVIEELGRTVVGKPAKQSDAVFRIRSYFSQNFTYSLNVAAPTPGTDPLLQFLTETRTGYCAHFASAAVLLLREAGFPARYAEGYYISPKLAGSVQKEKEVTLKVPDSAAHAWVELYRDGVGWVPVEVTPGFFEAKDGGSSAVGPSSQEPQTEPEETPPPEEQDEDSPEDADIPENKDAQNLDAKRHFPWALLLIPLLLLLLLVPILYERSVRKRIGTADSKETVALAYRYLMRVFRCQGLRPEETKPRTVAHLLGEEQEAYLAAVDLFNKETFSPDGLTAEERTEVCNTVLSLTSNLKLLRTARKQLRGKTNDTTEVPHGQ